MLFCLLKPESIYLQVTEELLIDFHELIRKHTGENMADAVWETLMLLYVSVQ